MRRTVGAWMDDGASSMGAALAFYTVLSMAPLLLIVITVAGFIFGEDAARGALFEQIAGMVGRDGASAIQAVLASTARSGDGPVSILVGLLTLLIGSTTVLAELQRDLDIIWHAPPRRGSGLMRLLRARLLAFSLILGVGFLLMVSLVVSATISVIGRFWSDWLGGAGWLLQVLNFALGFAIITALFAMIYKVLPRVRIEWRDVIVGGAITSLLFSVGKLLIGLYIGHASVASSFGASGTLIAVIVWVYYSAQIFLLGAAFTYQFALRHGSLAARRRPLH
ncbi:YihY/virulence factor BrkB family protein [Solimonas marina]|uniref:YihY/virulence factor BrkB family protein n=1 Tax=Solimonas marina TaxID=2714601 RepID=UPI00344DF9A8